MNKLVSEQLPNDGSYHVKRLIGKANARLKQIGRNGKRATIVARKSSLTLQFTFKDGNGRSQKNVGLGAIPVSANGIQEAENIARMVTAQLVAGKFTWDWFNETIGKDTSEQAKQLTCKEMVEQFKKHFFKQRQGNKNPASSWYQRCATLESVLGDLDKPLSLSLIRRVVETKANNSTVRKEAINGLVELLKYFNNDDYKQVIKDYKANNNPKRKKRNVPSDKRIMEVYKTGFIPTSNSRKGYYYRCPQWQFLYGLLATYGLRIHEAWSIANWDKPVTLKDGDWVTVDIDDETEESKQHEGEDSVIPAVLDPSNEQHILCIKHATKTGYRVAAPLAPEGHNWVEEFSLLQPLNLPDIKNPLEKYGRSRSGCACTIRTGQWFTSRRYGFSAHDLRHAYNHRGHRLGINPKALADVLGHSMAMNQSGYLRHMSASVKHAGVIDAISKEQNKRSENELLREENKALKSQLEAAQNKIELLETKLQLNKTIQES